MALSPFQHESQPDTPTEALDLGRDALGTASASALTTLDQLNYLRDLAECCRRFGYPLPYTLREIDRALAIVRSIAGRIHELKEESHASH